MRIGTDHTQKRRRRRRCVVSSEVLRFSMPSQLFARQQLLRCASWPALGKRARESQGTSGALEVQERQARTEPKGPRGALTRGWAQCSRGQEASPKGGQPWGPPWQSRKLPSPAGGAPGPPSWSMSSRHLLKMACPAFGWDRVNCLPSSWYSALFWISGEKTVENTLMV